MVSSRLLPPLPNDPAKTNWVEEEGGLPDYIVRVAKHIWNGGASHYTEDEAIAGAVNQTRKRATKGNKEAIAAIAQWEEMKARAHAKSGAKKLSNESISREKLASLVRAYKIHGQDYSEDDQQRIVSYIRTTARTLGH